jgi:8-oxo-dGTP pyrophosphatase MutT (NUDIX family)
MQGNPTEPREAATVIVLRGGGEALEVLLVKRNPGARFMPSAWVFPGGAVDAHDGERSGDEGAARGGREAAHRAAAVREMEEEAGLVLADPDALVPFSRWITPAAIPIRYDTHFFLAPAPPGQEARADGSETVDARWYTPERALDAYADGEIELVFPTIKHLEQLAPFSSADELLAWAHGREVVPVEPQIVHEGEIARVVLPGEPGYSDEIAGSTI